RQRPARWKDVLLPDTGLQTKFYFSVLSGCFRNDCDSCRADRLGGFRGGVQPDESWLGRLIEYKPEGLQHLSKRRVRPPGPRTHDVCFRYGSYGIDKLYLCRLGGRPKRKRISAKQSCKRGHAVLPAARGAYGSDRGCSKLPAGCAELDRVHRCERNPKLQCVPECRVDPTGGGRLHWRNRFHGIRIHELLIHGDRGRYGGECIRCEQCSIGDDSPVRRYHSAHCSHGADSYLRIVQPDQSQLECLNGSGFPGEGI